jgi:hypothetical protein
MGMPGRRCSAISSGSSGPLALDNAAVKFAMRIMVALPVIDGGPHGAPLSRRAKWS